MTEPEPHHREPLPGEVRSSRDPWADGPLPGLVFDDVTGRVIRADAVSEETGTPVPASEAPSSEPGPSSADAGPSSSGVPGPAHVPDRGPSRDDRRRDGRAMVPLLARALASQLEQVATDDETTPDGWWFTPDTDR
ncbi:hypothetical protein LQ327_28875 [Actinomycetospora endophytica]|uniref:Uncharacterized protein n=1 Tax=Actinomycetospora endophytica TaxID=2291215 RepID=A0ABS8PHI0_9PSEU|nr:hypothetical protein [Actinomycetospora endophytica]MCD2197392.1 hypothetical protein [Actinomycetospora endophytica]